ncbi:MAG: 3-isopropylmalate dehydratase large subunit [Armatimonadetes bacterium]|nr:3-isopropylmalate dehydratase large subunit [Armatimonadota bacterium]
MGMTLTEQILARHAGRDRVSAGENIWVDVDILLTHDVCGPGTIGIFKDKFGADAKVWDKERVVIIPDHYIFTADAMARRNIDILREFVAEQGLPYYYDPGTSRYKGVCHVALPEEGHTRPGELLLGTDSHTCTHGAFGMFATGVGNTDAALAMGTGKTWLKVPETMRFEFHGALPPYLMAKDLILQVIGDIGFDGATYRAMEFVGPAVFDLNIEERMTLCNMAIEAGGKNGVVEPDQVTIDYVNERIARAGTHADYTPVYDTADGAYVFTKQYDVSTLDPVVAKPHRPDNRASVREVAGTKVDRVYIGSCTGGKITDFEAAARLLAGREVRVDTFIVPATTEVARELGRRKIGEHTLTEIFRNAGCRLGESSCAACLGGPVDTFGRLNEPLTCVSTTNRNFPGRMGHKDGQVYLASPMTAAATALTGVITDPRDQMS